MCNVYIVLCVVYIQTCGIYITTENGHEVSEFNFSPVQWQLNREASKAFSYRVTSNHSLGWFKCAVTKKKKKRFYK